MRTRFVMYQGEPRALTNRVQKVGGTHRGYRMLFGPDGLQEVLPEAEWRKALMTGSLTPFPIDERIEDFSDRIGEDLTPQEALNRALAHARYLSETDREIEA